MELDEINDDLSRYEFWTPEKENEWIENSLKDQFKREGLEEGRQEGREQGIKEGFKEGVKEGIKEGIKEEKTNIIKSLYKNGASLDLISTSTNMTIEDIKEIIKDIEKEN